MLSLSLIEQMVCAIGIYIIGQNLTMNSLGGLMGSGLTFWGRISERAEDPFAYVVLYSCAQFTSAITTGALAERCYVDT